MTGPGTALVVDGANVVGSVPDGWWRDRAGAAARLHAALVAVDLPWEHIVLVLEGAARPGVPEGEVATVTTVHAPGSGDDEIVDRCGQLADEGARVVVVTADRGLVARLEPFDVDVEGPRALRSLLA
ncbi:hypothetical protein [Mobilicoccus pelagius]|uniref:NTP pyrophosphohydrolase n=1 Tax=Mobilicoccus pelagius NBRC 104925 TaxID=1089455 RepID=H5UR13_9MICO|nr:hypothetical protein [Mobilicoccus pelagius]GAB48171.1 hypothetical protein MOPEL_067_00200 [Mobilicoccus pelagius NBRC 104925]